MDDEDVRLRVVFVCSGNICRSPMAEKVFELRAAEAGLAGNVVASSAGVGPWHVGEPMDPRAAKVLGDHGVQTGHTAAQLHEQQLDADLLLAMDAGHFRELRRQVENGGGDPATVAMFRSFDRAGTASPDELDVPDPYYGGRDGFDVLYATIEAGVSGLLGWVRERG